MAPEKYMSVPEASLKGQVRTNLDSPVPTPEQAERKKRQTEKAKSLGLPTTDALPVVEDAAAIQPRSAEEIAKRAIAVAISAVKGEGMSHTDIQGIVSEWGVGDYFSPEEKHFIDDAQATDQERVKYAWRYECLDVLLWSLGYKSELPAPNEICDVKMDIGIITDNKGDLLSKNAKLRPMAALLDLADYYYRLHWAAIELRIKNQECNTIDEEIIMERHYALNWLTRYMAQAWDDITTDT